MTPKIYVDGQEGTTGLRIGEHLAARPDLELLRIAEEKRKDLAERKRLLNAADIVILCLPDVASREAVALIDNPRTRIIDASTAFRTDETWTYGLPELDRAQREKIRSAQRVAVPGCHASAYLLGLRPLVARGFIRHEAQLTCFSLTGYSGAGKKMITAYEAPDAPAALRGPRHYALKLTHKHLPEMRHWSGLAYAPLFTPVICPVHSGLAVETFLPSQTLARKASLADLHAALATHYAGEKFIRIMPLDPEAAGPGLDAGFLDITACNNTNRADIFVFGHDDQIAVITRLDNLGKGASGAAVQCMNLMLGVDESFGLHA